MRPIQTFTVVSRLPQELSRLPELAYNIRWSWDHETIALFQRMGGDLWEESGHNPVRMLGLLSQTRLTPSCDEALWAHQRVLDDFDNYGSSAPGTPGTRRSSARRSSRRSHFVRLVTKSIPNHSGSSVLAGDHLRRSDLNVPPWRGPAVPAGLLPPVPTSLARAYPRTTLHHAPAAGHG